MDDSKNLMGRWISVLYRQFQVYINKELKELNISSSEYIYIIELFMDDGVSQDDLSKQLFINKSAVARSISSLEKKNYVLRRTDKYDKRIKRVYLTEKSREIEEKLFKALENWDSIIKANIDESSVNITTKTLQKMSIKVLKKD
ncbi:MarR family winged helix-turn-helix transcriptional regulator [Oceanirhabdus seepicola]|uniref:MarR family transcriptional regulator n=1 Tax=Oceanirhabdus seepicola TaxID=2828781 RepID=A0A9J6P6D2_9CLOT|nr:MarR family transcriptional regulator [Oceanirhabdus seepicola]MCM1991357.1 MarR family transcriptional regulator [Oceanirhabdus seepicola]